MGMPIKKIIEIYNDLDRIGGIILRGNSEEETKYNCETIEALQSINVILHKYQKIEEIVEDRNSKPPLITLNRIIHEVEDGNNSRWYNF